jgi:membrane-associated phospholipid phosphatase
MLAILLMLLAGMLVHCPPPALHPKLTNLFPSYIYMNSDPNSFPSQSTTLYSSVAAGVYSLHKRTGRFLWLLVPICVALPRMYMGGHYFTDVVAGVAIGLAGYAIARNLLEARWTGRIEPLLEKNSHLRFLTEVIVFGWILQVTVEFKDVVWLKDILAYVVR